MQSLADMQGCQIVPDFPPNLAGSLYGMAAEWARPELCYNSIGTAETEAPVTAHKSHARCTVLPTRHTHLS